ncbi:MAG: prephenate dehydratase, partial [Nitrospinota bacterium]
VENSIEGMVSITLDLLTETNLSIVDEVFLPVSLSIASRMHSLSEVKTVYSHYQPLAQCHNWLSANLKGVRFIETSSSAEAAHLAAGEAGSAAICSDYAAEKHGLTVLEKSVEDNTENTTRFLVLGKLKRKRSDNDKTSLILSVADRPGALFSMLKPFADKNINLTKIESRPIKKRAWEYLFFIDFDGYQNDSGTLDVIEALEKESKFLKVLGSYPKVDFC